MGTVEFKIDNKSFSGIITFRILNNIREKYNISITKFFEKISNLDMEYISILILETTGNEEDLIKCFIRERTEEELIKKFENIFLYVNKLMAKCMPEVLKNKKDSEFEEFEEFEEDQKDWDLDYMEYVWETLLHRVNFYCITPRTFFTQFQIHKEINNCKKTDTVIEI